ncbi:MAG: penicillin-binding protein 2 [Pseudoflavonifractor sp.]|nr:penicillin-binding protein 2 [Alloprevotella sp.]MCM1117021.1 penicillin-binding protein 2 [Pseudoflavonifractor sp.]
MRKDYNLEKRKYVIVGFFLLIVAIYIFRLFNLQVADEKYKAYADSNAFLRKTIYPSRGTIYDRNGNIVVFNQPAYDIMFIKRDIEAFDTLDMCRALGISIDDFKTRWNEVTNRATNPGYSSYSPQTLFTNLTPEDYGRLQEKMYRYPGFYIQKRIVRDYGYHCAANVLGNIREVNRDDIEREPYYASGDYTGDNGVEKSYESHLRGRKGVEILIRDSHGQIQGRYEDGRYDVDAVSGRNLKLSLDIELQQYAESLMMNKLGAIVAIEPKTGEVLALVTAPSYDPALLVGRDRGKNYRELMNAPHRPLNDRATTGFYPPGSTFKPTQALIFLQEGIITPDTRYPCHKGYINGGLHVGCHIHASPLPLLPALQTSCNGYFCWGFKNMIDRRSKYGSADIAFEVWKNHLVSMGYGYKLGIDLPGEKRGFLPNAEYYSNPKRYGKGHWSANTVISVSIGQGEVTATPLQIANLCATIANRGWFITPHVVKEIEDTVIPPEYIDKRFPTIDSKYYPLVAEGMRMAVTGGTCRAANLPDIQVAGKTGTAQNPHGKDHSAFMGFAPYDDPKIAVAVYVENGGWGATYGVPIGSLIIEKYLNRKISDARKGMETAMLNAKTSQLSEYKY